MFSKMDSSFAEKYPQLSYHLQDVETLRAFEAHELSFTRDELDGMSQYVFDYLNGSDTQERFETMLAHLPDPVDRLLRTHDDVKHVMDQFQTHMTSNHVNCTPLCVHSTA